MQDGDFKVTKSFCMADHSSLNRLPSITPHFVSAIDAFVSPGTPPAEVPLLAGQAKLACIPPVNHLYSLCVRQGAVQITGSFAYSSVCTPSSHSWGVPPKALMDVP
jgi:hypothetical protein